MFLSFGFQTQVNIYGHACWNQDFKLAVYAETGGIVNQINAWDHC